MSKKPGTAEKLFRPLYEIGQSADDFKRRAFYNQGIAVEGANGASTHDKVRKVRAAYTVIEVLEELNNKERSLKKIKSRKASQAYARDYIYAYFDSALKARDGNSLRLLADLLENHGAKSDDALCLNRGLFNKAAHPCLHL